MTGEKDSGERIVDKAYDAGKDCAINGADTTNCHFSLFSSPEIMKSWQKGKNDGEEEVGKK